MDFKGITWVGNIYQRFEAMCLEVEEAMYEDTVKYMEGQANKVGGSVKKFYSEIVQDLLPPSCIVPEHDASGDYILNSYGHIDVAKKPRLSKLDAYGELKKKETEDFSGFGDDNVNRERDQYSPPPIVFVESIHSDGCKKPGIYRRPVGIKRISRISHSTKASVSLCERIHIVDEAEKNTAPNSPTSIETTATGKITAGSERIFETKTPTQKNEEPNGASTDKTHDANQVDSAENLPSNEDKPTKESLCYEADFTTRTELCCPEPESEKDNLDIEVIERNEMSRLEETCILVEAIDELDFEVTRNSNKTYKKKIREALASKLRHKKKQPQIVKDVVRRSPAHGGSSESEWEIL